MSNEVAKKPVAGAPATLIPSMTPAITDSEFDALSMSGKYLPRLMLYGGGSDAVKMGKMQVGQYGLVVGKDQIIPLGSEVDILVISIRATALDTLGEETVVSSHDKDSPEFKEIAYRAENEDNSGCMYGPEFLIYIPALKKFAAYLMGNKSSRREAPALKGKLSGAATLKATLVSNKRYKWHVPVVTNCSTPFEIPSLEEIKEKAEAFNNPPKEPVKEKVEKAATATTGRAR